MTKGTFCLSIDTELLWGRHDKPFASFIPKVAKERIIITKLLRFAKEYRLPITWAVVGHLFLKSCKPVGKIKHPEIVPPEYSWVTKEWFVDDPSTNLQKAPGWYGTDIIELIKKTPLQEIASHSFSHVLFGESGCPRITAETEVKECVALAKKRDIQLHSFVFPVNSIGHLDILRKYGFIAYRGVQPNISRVRGVVHTIQMFFDFFLPTPPRVSQPKIESGIINIPASMYFLSNRGKRKYIPKGYRTYKAKLGIDKAIQENKVFHLWLHPVDLVDSSTKLLDELKEILVYAAKKREQGLLNIQTMEQIAKEVI